MVEEKISEIKSYAKENNVPIMMDDGIDFLTSLIRQRKVKNITNITMVSFLITEFGLLGQRKKMIQFGIIGMSPHVADGVLTEK